MQKHTLKTIFTLVVSILALTFLFISCDVVEELIRPSVEYPTAEVVIDFTGFVGNEVKLDGSNSTDPEGGVLTYSWEFNGCPPGSGYATGPIPIYETSIVAYFTPTVTGDYFVVLKVRNQSGRLGSVQVKITAVSSNQKPTSVAGTDQTVYTGDPVSFDGSFSSDPDNAVLTYFWNFDDGNTDTGVNPTNIYATAGVYIVTLTVEDTEGETDTDTMQVTVRDNQFPVANASADPLSVYVNNEVYFSSSGSYDPDQDIGGDIVSYSWDFGDGGTLTIDDPTHIYTVPKTYTVTLTVTDDKGDSGTDTVNIEVVAAAENRAPTAVASSSKSEYNTNEPVYFYGYQSSDPDIDDTLSYSWDFKDGETSIEPNPTHYYKNNDKYTVTLTVTDDGTSTKSDTAQITVLVNFRPTASASADNTNPYVKDIVYFTGIGSDQDKDILTYSWDFGDGSIANGEKVSHGYDRDGTYTVTLTVSDTYTSTDASLKIIVSVRPLSVLMVHGGGSVEMIRKWLYGSSVVSDYFIIDGSLKDVPDALYMSKFNVVIVASYSQFLYQGEDGSKYFGDQLAKYVEGYGGKVVLLGATLFTEGGGIAKYTLQGTIIKYSPLHYGDVVLALKEPYNYLSLVEHPITYKVRSLETEYYGKITETQESATSLGEYRYVPFGTKPPGTLRGLIGAYYNEKLPVVALNWMPFDEMWDGDFLLMLENTLKWFSSTDW